MARSSVRRVAIAANPAAIWLANWAGRGSTRRYCSAACGTRERVAAYREARDSMSEAAAP